MNHTHGRAEQRGAWTIVRVENDLPHARAARHLAHLAPAPARVARGTYRATATTLAWLTDHEGRREVRALAGGDTAQVRLAAAARHRDDMVLRLKYGGAPLAVALLVAAWAWWHASLAWQAGTALLVLLAAWAAGRPTTDDLTPPPAPDEPRRVVPDVVRDAFAAAVPKVHADDVRVHGPAVRTGPGWTVDVTLPAGITAGDALRHRDRIASALLVPADTLVLEPGHGSAAHVILTVIDKPLRAQHPSTSPYLEGPAVDAFDGVELGLDAKGSPVRVPLLFAAGLVGSKPRCGKTAAVRHILAAASLDPRVELHVHDFKGSRDLGPFAQVADYFGAGDSPADIAAARRDLEAVHARMTTRYATMRTLTDEQSPDGQTNTRLADDPTLDLWPLVVAWDEAHTAFGDDTHGDALAAVFEDLVRRGPAVGITAWAMTQRPDGDSIPAGIASNASVRVCLAVDTWQVSDMILGTGSHAAGVSGTDLTVADKGVAWVKAPTLDAPVLVRSHYLDLPATRRVVALAAARRAETAGQRLPEPGDDVRARLRAAWPATRHGQPATGMWLPDIAAALHLPEHAVADALTSAGLAVEPVALYQPATADAKAGTRRRPGVTWRQLDGDLGQPGEVLHLARGAA